MDFYIVLLIAVSKYHLDNLLLLYKSLLLFHLNATFLFYSNADNGVYHSNRQQQYQVV